MAERSNRIEIGGSTDVNLDRRVNVEWFGPADGEYAAASKAEIEQRHGQTLVVDMVNCDAHCTVCNEYRSQLCEHLGHHVARIEVRVHSNSMGRHEPDSIERSATHHANGLRALSRPETREPFRQQTT